MKNTFITLLLPIIFTCLTSFAFGQREVKKSTDSLTKYGIYSVKAYFSGNGLPYITQQVFIGSDLQQMYKSIDSASNGAIVTLDELRYVDPNGKTHAINEVTYNFNKGKTITPYKSPGALEFEKIRNLEFISGIVYFSGAGFSNMMAIDVKNVNFLRKCFEKVTSGTTIKFDKCISKNQNGSSSEINKSITL